MAYPARVVSALLRLAPEQVRGLSAVQYDALVAAGMLDGQRVELLEGVLVEVAPSSPEHSATVRAVARALLEQLPSGWDVREEKPLRVSPSSEPEPDIAVVRDADWSTAHPTTALVLVEVARTSLVVDLEVKPAVYAAAGVREYWVIDLAARVVHVHRRPTRDGYDEVVVHRAGPLRSSTEPVIVLDVADVLAPE